MPPYRNIKEEIMTFGYWFVNTFCWINFLGGLSLGVYGWNKYGDKIKKICKNLTSK